VRQQVEVQQVLQLQHVVSQHQLPAGNGHQPFPVPARYNAAWCGTTMWCGAVQRSIGPHEL
jgi:hypothetical protein